MDNAGKNETVREQMTRDLADFRNGARQAREEAKRFASDATGANTTH